MRGVPSASSRQCERIVTSLPAPEYLMCATYSSAPASTLTTSALSTGWGSTCATCGACGRSSSVKSAITRSKSPATTASAWSWMVWRVLASSMTPDPMSGPRQPLVRDPVRPVGLVAQPGALVLLVGLEVPLEPHDLRVALEGEHVRGDAVEEPAIVGDDHRAAREVEQRLLERAQGVDVEVVGRLVEQQDVAALAQQLGQVHAVAHAAAQRPDLLLLVGALEVEARAVGARVHLAVAHLDLVHAAGDLLPDGLVGVERVARLVDVGELDAVADDQVAGVGLLGAGDHLEQRRLARAVGADDADDRAARQVEGDVLHEQAVAEALAQVGGAHDVLAQALARRDVDLHVVELGVALGGDQRLVVVQPRLLLGLAALGVLAHPLELGGDRALAGLLGLLLLRQALLLLLEPARVVALERQAAASIELEDPARDVVEEVAVVRDGDDGALVVREEALQPCHRLRVEMVRRLVEE